MSATSRRPASVPLARLGEWLVALSCLYLGIPALLFFGFWWRAPWNLVSIALLGWCFWRLWPRLAQPSEANVADESTERVPVKTLPWCFLPWLLAAPFSGVGALSSQHGDWHKHNAVLLDLVHRPWPIEYSVGSPDGGNFYLLYYLGYYLPAAAVARVVGEGAVELLLLGWTLLGLALLCSWLVFWTRGRAPWVGFAFFAFDGLKPLGYLCALICNQLGWWNLAPFDPLDAQLQWWAGRPHFQISSPWLALGVVPQHALSGWLAAALVGWSIYHLRARQTPIVLACTLPFSLLWSAFVGFSIAFFTLAALFWQRRESAKKDPSRFAMGRLEPWFFAMWFTLSVTLYYVGRGPMALLQEFPSFPPAAWASSPQQGVNFLLRYGLWTAFEWALLVWMATRLRGRAEAQERLILGVTFSLLLLLPFLHVGRYNDLLMRGVIPTQFFVFLWIFNALRSARLDGQLAPTEAHQSRSMLWKPALMALLILASLSNLRHTRRGQLCGIANGWRALQKSPVPVAERDLSLLARWQKQHAQPTAGSLEFDFEARPDNDSWQLYRSQYLGRADSWWWRTAARNAGRVRRAQPEQK